MKTILKMLATVLLVSALTGCAAQKPTAKAEATKVKTEARHEQALQAIEARKFIIKATGEFFFTNGSKPTQYSTGCYISMQNRQAVMRFPKELIGRSSFDYLNMKDDAVVFSINKQKKNGDQSFTLKIHGGKVHYDRDVLVTLYNNSNKCFVQVNQGSGGHLIVSFQGEIYPYYE